jgi:L-2,4-diaminobutyrate decarboxylase
MHGFPKKPLTEVSAVFGEERQATARIRAAYDPSLLASAGAALAAQLGAAMAAMQNGEGPVLPQSVPEEQVRDALAWLEQADRAVMGRAPSQDTAPLPEAAALRDGVPTAEDSLSRFADVVQTMLARSIRLHHPHAIGHQVAPPAPLAGLFDAVGSVANQGMAIYEMGPWATAVEEAMVRRIGSLIGWPEGSFSGLATHGGSLANLTALTTARNVAFPTAWERGLPRESPPPVIVAHADAHYCITRSAGLLGLGTRQIVPAALDRLRRIDPERLDKTLRRLKAAGSPVMAVVACSCSTPVGAFDPLEAIADVCHSHGVWLHVDAAHGGGVLTSARHRQLLAGIERADSLILDAHKMLFMPALCTFVFYRQRRHGYAAFQQDAPYLFPDAGSSGSSCRADFDGGLRTIECTKRATVFGLWGVWSLFGQQLFSDLVDTTFAAARRLHGRLAEVRDFEPFLEPQANIVTFRHMPDAIRDQPDDVISAFQRDLRQRLVESGSFYIVTTNIDGMTVLRTTVMNPFTTDTDFKQLLDALRETGQQLVKHGIKHVTSTM